MRSEPEVVSDATPVPQPERAAVPAAGTFTIICGACRGTNVSIALNGYNATITCQTCRAEHRI